MRALVYERFGGPEVITIAERPEREPGRRELVVRVLATAVNSGDARLRAADFPPGMGLLGRLFAGLSGPRQPVLGADVVGVVERVGASVTEFSTGDRVAAMTGMRMGAHAERCVLSADHCTVAVPDGVTAPDALSTIFGGTTALTYLEAKARVQPGERVLVLGASGAVGAATVQVARLLGARVTGVCSGRNAELVRSLGAEEVIDYTQVDVFAGDRRWDVVIDSVGVGTVRQLRQVATPRGRIGLVAAGLPAMLMAPWVGLTSDQRLLVGVADESPVYVTRLLTWLEEGRWTPVIDSTYPWEQGAAAHARVDSRRKRGSVILRFGTGDQSSYS